MTPTDEPSPLAPAENFAAFERACELGLREHLPGLEIVDRELELDSGNGSSTAARHADLLAVDGSGRAILITSTDGSSDETLLAALASLAFARTHAEMLGRHVGSHGEPNGSIVRRRAPLSIVVAESFSPAILERLACVPERELRLFEVCEVRTAHSTSMGFRSVRRERGSDVTADRFIAALAGVERSCAEVLARRIQRLDDQVTCVPGEDALAWRVGARDVCQLERGVDGLEAWTGADAESVALRRLSDVDEVLDRVIRAHVLGLSDEPAAAVRPTGALLSPEEIAAFRE